uniref:Uncharacterized protein n=1 Tax=Magallana gigas TaxID=29159 RepID=K1PMJ3_MAGGI
MCRQNGRFVIYYNNRTQFPLPDGYSVSAESDLCEVEVYGCSKSRHFGDNCSTPCHQNCLDGRCDVVYGTCLGCIPGYTGPTCDTALSIVQRLIVVRLLLPVQRITALYEQKLTSFKLVREAVSGVCAHSCTG